jgi:ferredoxin-type protein NapH
MSRATQNGRIGPTGKPIRRFEMPHTLAGRLWVWRYLILRRITQLAVLLLFVGTMRWGWEVGDRLLLSGNLSSAELLGTIPMADPFAVLQMLLTGRWVDTEILVGAGVILAIYAVLGGRSFCAWVCPTNMVTDLAAWLRQRLGIKDGLLLSRRLRYGVLGLVLVLSPITGLAAFEWLSPMNILHRGVIYGIGYGWMAVLALFLFDLAVVRQGWCGHVCPLGAFYALWGRRTAQLRVRFDAARCTHCGECTAVCPEPHVLNLKQAARHGMVISSECSNCGRCTSVCPEGALGFGWRLHIARQPLGSPVSGEPQGERESTRRAA